MASLIERGTRRLRREWVRRTAVLRAPLRAGLIGYGAIASEHLDGYLDCGLSTVVGISDLVPSNLGRALDRCPQARAYTDFRQMLDETRPDVVSICTWPQTHAEVVEAAAAAGVRGILCEKPLALRLEDLERMRTACRKHSVKLAGGHQYRFHLNFIKAAELIASGRLGKVGLVKGHIKSTLANNGPHLIDTARFILGDPVATQASGHCRRERGEFNRGIAAEDGARGEIRFGQIRFECLTGDLSPDFFLIIVEGSEGKLEVSPQVLKVNGELATPKGATMFDCRVRQFREFVRWVKGQRGDYAAEFEQGARAVELVLALYESSRLDQPVVLPLTEQGDIISKLYPAADVSSADQSPVSEVARSLSTSPGAPGKLAMHGGTRAVPRWFSTRPKLGARELSNLTRVVLSKNLSCTGGQMVPALEAEFCRYYGSPHAVASTSGTAAIHVALAALNLEPGDEVVTTPMTDMGTVIPILASNCIPIFADIDPLTGNLTADSIRQKLSPRTRAVILVHLFGQPADLSGITGLLRDEGIPLIEDCAQAHGAEYQGRKVGTFGDLGCFSFQQSKQITCGDGGVTLVNRSDLFERASLFVDKGWDRKQGARAHKFLGMNYRMTELQGAVALAQMKRLPGLLKARRESANRLIEALQDVPGVVLPRRTDGMLSSWWFFPFRISEEILGMDTTAFAEAMIAEGVRVGRAYLPAPLFEYDVIKHQRTYGQSRFPFSSFSYHPPVIEEFPGYEEFTRRLLLMQWSHHARDHHVDGISTAIRKVCASLGRVQGAPRETPLYQVSTA
jgi:dTDP-4-amino-4,6-dideoxygalactose transaminase/predicted dehydrogenase